MKRVFLPAVLLISIFYGNAQALKKYAIGNSGCSIYMLCNPTRFDEAYSQDSSKVYTAECVNDEIRYGVICAKLLNPIHDLNTAEELVVSYLDFLKVDFEITSSAGYGKGHRLNNNENTRGIIDYWKDKENSNWKVKAWTDGKFIAVLYANSKKELPETKVDVFLNGLRFSGM
jgi:hypothetical protein